MDQLYTVPEVLGRLRTSRTKFYELVRTGQLSTVKIGSRTYVRADELARFIGSLA